MQGVKYKRSKEGEVNRLASLPKGKAHWKWSNNPTVLTLHKRIHRKYGKASDHKCACGKKAFDWACQVETYTDKIEDYKPMCRLCHVRKDKAYMKNRSAETYHRERDKFGRFTKSK